MTYTVSGPGDVTVIAKQPADAKALGVTLGQMKTTDLAAIAGLNIKSATVQAALKKAIIGGFDIGSRTAAVLS